MFYFSFLVKEGKASIELDDDKDSEYHGDYVACKPAVICACACPTTRVGRADVCGPTRLGWRVVTVRCEPPTEDDKANNNTTSQLVFELTQEIWEKAIEGYNIKHPLIPTRKEETLAPGARKAKW